MTELAAHSPLGGSAAPRYIKCPGSVSLAQGITDAPEDDEFSAPGTLAHSVGAHCLTRGQDAWELVNAVIYDGKFAWEFGGIVAAPGSWAAQGVIRIDSEMADAVQVYLDAVRKAHPDRNQGNTWIERRFHCPTIHKYYYGTADLVHLEVVDTTTGHPEGFVEPGWLGILHVWDYKHGVGVIVEVKDNEQCMFYACGVLEDLDLWDKVDRVTLHIVQPRAPWHPSGVVREWSISTDDLRDWLEGILIPAMNLAMVSHDTHSGEHCRFCPVRFRACPSLAVDMDELEKYMAEFENATPAKRMTGPQISRILELHERSVIVNKAAKAVALQMLKADPDTIPGCELGKAKSDRVWLPGASLELAEAFGSRAYENRKLKSPAQIEKLSGGVDFVAKYAKAPDKGQTVVPAGRGRSAVKTKNLFKPKEKK